MVIYPSGIIPEIVYTTHNETNTLEVPIEQINPSRASYHRVVWLSLDGTNKKTTKGCEYWVQPKHLWFKDTCNFFQSNILKSVKYSLVSLTLTEEECCNIEWPMLKQVMKSSIIPDTIITHIHNRPSIYQELYQQYLFITQGIQNIKTL